MKIFRLKDLIDNKDNPKIIKKILDSTELSKLDKKDILNDLKGIKTNKEELILDSDTIKQKCYFVRMDNLLSFWINGIPQNELWYTELTRYIQYLSAAEGRFTISKPLEYDMLGFRYNIGLDDYDIPDEILEYFIEVPFTRFYDKNTNFFCYGGDMIQNGKELYKRFSKLNLTEGEWFVPNGYIFMIPDIIADDRGIIRTVRKVGDVFEIESYRNGLPEEPRRLLPTGEIY